MALMGSENKENESVEISNGDHETKSGPSEFVNSENVSAKKDLCEAGSGDMHASATKSSARPRKIKRVATKPRGRKYSLRSSEGGARVLRSQSSENCKTQTELVTVPVNPVSNRRKKRKKLKTPSTDEYSQTRRRIRYLLNRIKYEQNLIDAYAGEGWRGQSAEKIRPEKELERAKSEILRCKMKIRNIFRHLDSSSSEGRFEESLFDSEGEISSEDIFCAKCRLTDSSIDNDIILCDGMCDRGFHQKCLNPPLLTADIPVGDEGWLCPACDCKVDCIDLVNEYQDGDASVEDTWEKIFPEAAAIENGNKQSDDFPSDDSEDDEYDPDRPEADVEKDDNGTDNDEQSESDESNSSSAEDSDVSACPKQSEYLGFPSDDSEDDDFDPDVPDSDKDIQKDGSNSDTSDFTSDSDDFCKELSKISCANEDSASSLPENGKCPQDTDHSLLKSEGVATLEGEVDIDNVLVSRKRQIERLDYKKKYEEAYGKSSSESSEDEDWCESEDMSTPKKRKRVGNDEQSQVLSKANNRKSNNKINTRSDVGKLPETNASDKLDSDTAKANEQHHAVQESNSSVTNSSTSSSKKLGNTTSQKLNESFLENQYPSREKKESLAQEFGLTVRQVSKWFENARQSHRVSVKEASEQKTKHDQAPTKPETRAEDNKDQRKTIERECRKVKERSCDDR